MNNDFIPRQIIAAPGEKPLKQHQRDNVRFRFWDTRSQYQDHTGFRPAIGKVFEVWKGRWGDPRLQVTFETGHRRFWHRPKVYDLNSDRTQWVKGVSGFGFFLAVAVRRWK